MTIATETATVYRGGGRRWFTRSSAINAEAKFCYRKVTALKSRCDCDTKKVMRGAHMKSGVNVSCGCHKRKLHTKHGMHSTRQYRIWRGMLSRCLDPGRKEYQHYGGRGISVCERWLDFNAFWVDMRDTYADYLSIDRIDVNGNYDPSNCRWATYKQQARNTRKNHIVELNGVQMTIVEASEITGIGQNLLCIRAAKGETGERLFAKRLLSGRNRTGETQRPIVEAA